MSQNSSLLYDQGGHRVVSLVSGGASFGGKMPKSAVAGGSLDREHVVDAETKIYADAKMDVVKAQNDASFATVLSRIDILSAEIPHLKPVPLVQMIGVAFSVVVALAGILGLMADRFDGGISASSLVSGFEIAQKSFETEQKKRDAAQDAKLDKAIGLLQELTLAQK